MLVLTRHQDQGLRLFDAEGHYVGHIVVLGIDRGRVKLGIDADERFLVLRDEVLDRDPAAATTRHEETLSKLP